VSLPDYRIEPPDILLIQGIRVVPKTPYAIQPNDVLNIAVLGTTPDQPIAGPYLVEPSGVVNLGPAYAPVRVEGLTSEEAADAIRRSLLRELQAPEVAVTVLQTSAQQVLDGEHLVGPDGHVNLGIYGRVYVAGMTLDEARAEIERRLEPFFEGPQISIDILVYNSKFFYVISEGGGLGENVARIPSTGNETVLDAIAQIGGLDQTASTKIWISRPVPQGVGCDQILPVDWKAITRGASTATNYQLLPGDRLFIAEDRLIAFNSFTAKLLNPFERLWGFTLLGAQTVQTLQRFPEGLLFR
jgi:polysaccharide export outer membrane protein